MDQGTVCAFKFKFQILNYKRQIKYFQISIFAFQLECHIHAPSQISHFMFQILNHERRMSNLEFSNFKFCISTQMQNVALFQILN